MADKKRIEEGLEKGVFESPVGTELQIAGTELKSKEKDFEITVGEEALKGLQKLGVSKNADGTMSIPTHNTEPSKKRKTDVSKDDAVR